MTSDNPYIPKPAIPIDESFKDIEKERVLKEDLKNTRLASLNAGSQTFIFPDENE